jgi:hypothetical protein
MSRDADANVTYVTFWFDRQCDILTKIDPITGNGVASK